MRLKSDFVTNSSSSSFVVLTKKNVTEIDVKKVIAKLCGTSELLPFLPKQMSEAFTREMETATLADVLYETDCSTIAELKEEYPEYEHVEEYPVIYTGRFGNDSGESVENLLCDSDINYRDENMIIKKEGGF